MLAALTITFAACGNKSGNAAGENKDEKKIENTSEEKATPTYITYTNEKYGFSVEVPDGMTRNGELMGEEGTVYSIEDGSGISLNRIDISGGKQIFDEEYTPEKVKKDFEYWTENKDVFSKECGDDYFEYIMKGELLTELYHFVYKGNKVAMISVCYDADHEKQLGGEVAKHVFNSVTFK